MADLQCSTENRVKCGHILRYTNCSNSVCFEYDIEVDNFPAQYHVKQIVYKTVCGSHILLSWCFCNIL